MRIFQKGQAIVEFAFVLPLFLLIIIGILNFGMIFMDYQSLNGIARSSARQASQITNDEYEKSGYKVVYDTYSKESLPVSIYQWDPSKRSDFKIEYIEASQSVKVSLKAIPTTYGNGFFSLIYRVIGEKRAEGLFTLEIEYIMRSESAHDS